MTSADQGGTWGVEGVGMWEQIFDRMLTTILRRGSMSVIFPSGKQKTYGDGSGAWVEVTFHTIEAVRKIIKNPELTAGEVYTDGTMTIADNDLRGFLTVVAMNQGAGNLTWLQRSLDSWRTIKRKASMLNPVGVAQKNVAHHYDLSAKLYDLFLDEDKQYSCAYFRTPNDTLEQAQKQKKAHIARKLCIEPGMRVLDIGCGWGGMGLTLARDFDAQVTGVTLSEEQHKIASRRAINAGLANRIDFRLQDYRLVEGQFDRIVSVGMFEHVGVPHYDEYFGHVREKLTDDGIALIHTIGRTTPPGATNPWILKYIFPGGYIPSMSEALVPIERQDLYPTDVEIWRLHYAETLRHWHKRFVENWDKVRDLYDERFCRMWNWYLVACEMTFRYNRQCVFQFQLAKRQNAVPLTREYLYDESSLDHQMAAE